jgi:hypothetical protein
MNDRIQNAFDVCLTAMHSGVELEACLNLYPDIASDLMPLLETAWAAQQIAVKDAPKTAANRSRATMLAQAANLRQNHRTIFPLFRLPRLAFSITALLIVLFFSFNRLVATSAKSLPGDALYPVKRVAENVRLQLSPNIETKYRIEERYNQLRSDEVKSLLQLNRVEHISLEGIVYEITPDRWIIEDISVVITSKTVLIGDITLGKVIEVEGYTQPSGWIVADELHLRYDELSGEISAIEPRQWTIGGTTFKLLSGTQIDPSLRLGDRALVLVYLSDDGSLYARSIIAFPKQASDFDSFEIEFNGVIEAINGDQITIDSKTIHMTETTALGGDLTIGSLVTVHALVAPDGTLTALEIKAIASADQATMSTGEDYEEDETGNPKSTETLDLTDDDDETTVPAETSVPDDDDNDEAPEPTESPEPDNDDNDETTEPAETSVPDDDDDDEAPEPTKTSEPDDDDNDEIPETTETPEPDNDDDVTPESTESPDSGDFD